MYWNNRVVAKTYRKGEPTEETLLEIHECFYEGEASESKPDDVPGSCTVDAVGVHGDTLEELRETLERMLRATKQPVLDYDAIGGKAPPR
jgi:hypothetical protein